MTERKPTYSPHIAGYNEKELLQKLAEGDKKAFTLLYNKYYPLLIEFSSRYLKSNQMAEDAVQEIFMKLLQMGPALKDIDSLRSYLVVTARNHVLNILKRIAVSNTAKAEILKHYEVVADEQVASMYWKEYQQYIQEVLSGLPEKTATIFRLIREEEKSYEEVAKLLGISRNVVKKHVMKSNEAFREALKKNGPLIILVGLQRLFI